MYFFFAQILFALWAIVFAHFQIPIIKDRRDYVPINSNNENAIHTRGVITSAFVGFVIKLCYFTLTNDWKGCICFVPMFYGSYRILFDGWIGKYIYKDFYYLGTTAKQDIWFNTHFPHDKPGVIKNIFCIIVIISITIIKYLLL